MTIPFVEEEVYVVKYKCLHPQSKRFVERFGLDLRIFDRETISEELGKRSFKTAFKKDIDLNDGEKGDA